MLGKKRKHHHYRKKRISLFRKRWFYDFILVLIFFGSLFYLLFGTPFFEIKSIEISGEDKVIAGKVKKMFSDGSNLFLLKVSDIVKIAEENFPKIKELKIYKEFPDKILVKIIERKPFGILCPKTASTENISCFLLSEDGVIFSNFNENNMENVNGGNGNTDEEEKLVRILKPMDKKPKLGEKVLEDSLIKDIASIKNELRKSEILLSRIEISTFEIKAEVFNSLNRHIFLIHFSTETEIENQLKVLLEIIEEKISKEEKEKLEYIDLRGIKEGKKSQIYWK